MKEMKIDKNQIIGFLLIGAIMLWFAWWSKENAPEEPAKKEAQQEQVEETNENLNAAKAKDILPAATQVSVPDSTAGDSTLQNAVAITPEIVWLENSLLRVGITNQGAQIVNAELKKFQTYDSLPLNLVDSNQALIFKAGEANAAKAVYQIEKSADGTQATLTGQNPEGPGQWQIVYQLPEDSYQLDINVNGSGFSNSTKDFKIDWQIDAFRTEKSIKTERQIATVYYWQEDDYESLSVRGNDDEAASGVDWIAYKQHFFSSILKPASGIENANMATLEMTDDTHSKSMGSQSTLSAVGADFSVPMQLYYGPNKYKTLKQYDERYGDVIDFGWGIFGWISRGVVIPIFNWLEQYGINYGIIILIMALLIKLVLFPLTYTSYKSMAKMRVLKPEMDEINEKYKGKDAVKKNQAVMQLYQEAGVNPLGGCIPMLVQMPILFAMFRFFPASIELRQQPFLWANDLSSYDSIISWQAQIPLLSDFYGNHISLFTVLMTISTLIYTYMNSQMQGNSNQIPGMKYIMYGMPVMLLFWFNSYSSGLSYYYFVANIITFSQQWLIRKTLDEDAIHAKLQAKRAKPKKKSKFQQRIEEMQNQQRNARRK